VFPLAAQQPAQVTLREAIALAARHDPNVVQAQGDFRSAGATVRSAKGAYLPDLSANASGGSSFSDGPSRTDPITGEVLPGGAASKSVGMGLSASLDIFDGFRRGADVRAARGREDQAEATLTEALAQSALQVSTEFFNALSSRELVAVRQETVRRGEEQLLVAVAKLVTRAANVADSLRAVVQLGEARLQLVSEEARLASSELNLARRLGVPGRVVARSDSSLIVPGAAIDSAALLVEALARAPSVQSAEASVRAAQAAVSAAKSVYWPRLVLSGSYQFAGNDRTDYELFNNRSIQLGVSWPLFNRFQREEQVVRQQVALDTERARLADARREVESRLSGQFAGLEAARQRIELTRLSVDAARADVTIALERYRLGAIGIVDLNTAQSGLTRAEESAVSARFEYLRARAEIEAILGRPL
jgi:outer membrane protein TolC